MAYGVQPEGFVIKPVTAIQSSIVQRCEQSDALGPNQDYGDTDPMGQVIGAVASELGEVWELGYAVHTSGDPEAALDVPLDQLLSLTGSDRPGAQPSRILGALLTLDPGTTVPAGSLCSVAGRPDIVYSLDADVENAGPLADDFPGDFTCTEDGPTVTNAGALTVIDTAVSGWTAVTNPNEASLGRLIADNVEFRQRWADEQATHGSTTVAAIRAALLNDDPDRGGHEEFATIEKVLVLENKEDEADANGLPPHSIEAIVDDGVAPTVENDLIAQTIWEQGAAGGIDTYGAETGTATDSEGAEHAIQFSRVTRLPVYITLTIKKSSNAVSTVAESVKRAIVDAGNATYDVEIDVIALYLRAQALTVAGVVDVPEFALGFAPSPTEDDNLPIGYRERATFAVDRVDVTVT